MLATLIAVAWKPELHGIVVIIIAVVVFVGGPYLVVGTNVGARLGVLIVLAGLFGWLMVMGCIWWTYGIGLKGPDPSWNPASPITIIRDTSEFQNAGLVSSSIATTGVPLTDAANASNALQRDGWHLLEDADPQRGQAVASSDEILQVESKEFLVGDYLSVAVYDRGGERWPKINDSLDFIAFFHKPHYAVVEVVPVVAQRVEPGRAPARPVADITKPHRYVYMLRDLGARRQPAMFIAFGSGLIFFMLCWVLHRRDLALRVNLSAERSLTKV